MLEHENKLCNPTCNRICSFSLVSWISKFEHVSGDDDGWWKLYQSTPARCPLWAGMYSW